LVTVAERDRQRSRLVNVLIVALALLTAATIPGYWGTPNAALALMPLGAALAIYFVAFLTNGVFKRTATGAYVLVVGGGLALAAQAIGLAAAGSASEASHAALLLSAVILIAGLLFVPEVTLITAFAATACTAFALLFGLASDHSMGRHDAYLVVVYTLGLQLVAALVAWLLAQFIFESALETQRAQEMQFAQARLEALSGRIEQDEQRLGEHIAALQVAITHAMMGEYGSRAELEDSPLLPLAESLNLLLSRFETATQAEQRQSRMDAAALPLVEALARLAESGTPTPNSLPIMTNTPLDSVSMLLSQMYAMLTQRLGRMQRLVGEVADVASHSADPIAGATGGAQEAQRIGGKLKSDAERLLQLVQQQLAEVRSLRRAIGRHLPQEITGVAAAGDAAGGAGGRGPSDATALLGLGPDLGVNNPGYTGVFQSLGADGEGDETHDFAPMTVPLPAVGSGETSGVAAASGDMASGELLSELTAVWQQLGQVETDLMQLERVLRQLARDLGVQSRHLRSTDANIAWFRTALEAIGSNAEQLQQLAGQAFPAFGAGDMGPGAASRPLGQGAPTSTPMGWPAPTSRPRPPAFGPQHARPLPEGERPDDASRAGPTRQFGAAAGEPPPSPPSGAADESSTDEGTPAPGSLRASDLISLDGIEGSLFGEPPDTFDQQP
jgi:hypothetical protein